MFACKTRATPKIFSCGQQQMLSQSRRIATTVPLFTSKAESEFIQREKEEIQRVREEKERLKHQKQQGRSEDQPQRQQMSRGEDNVNPPQHQKGGQGFASMPKEKVQEIASKGGRQSHGGKGSEGEHEGRSQAGTHEGNSNKGFASMPKEKVQEIASKGGRSSHGGRGSEGENRERESDRGEMAQQHEGKSHRGFAAMPKEKVQEIASKGGQHSHGGRGHEAQQSHRGGSSFGNQGSHETVQSAHAGKSRNVENEGEASVEGKDEHGAPHVHARGAAQHGNFGFANMSNDVVREIAAMGGRARGEVMDKKTTREAMGLTHEEAMKLEEEIKRDMKEKGQDPSKLY